MGSVAPVSRTGTSVPEGASWLRLPITYVEDLKDAVRGAGLEATQLSSGSLSGNLTFIEDRGVLYGSGLIGGRVALSGALSPDRVTLGLGLRLAPGTRHWLNEVSTGDVGLFLPGDEHDSIYGPGSLYFTATLSAERLEEEAAQVDLVLDRKMLGGSGVHRRKASPRVIAAIAWQMDLLHHGLTGQDGRGLAAARQALALAIEHYAREPRQIGGRAGGGYTRIFARARRYIVDNLDEPLSIEALSIAAGTSRRTLHRAFLNVIDESPQSYVRRLRLHRIRRDLASQAEAACTVALAANRWGIGELGRLAGLYRELFGELPSQTLIRARRLAANRI